MKRVYLYVLITYIVMQLSGIVGIRLFFPLFQDEANSRIEALQLASAYWSIFSFAVAIAITIWLLRNEWKQPMLRGTRASVTQSIQWAIGGTFLALFAQAIAGAIEQALFQVPISSENTTSLLQIAGSAPLFIIVITVFAPVLEEIIFRKIIFGSLYQRFSFVISAFISSVIFGVVHGELSHLLIYSAMGFTFAFLYVKTNRIIVPIIAHVAMNTLVVVAQFNIVNT